MWYHVILYPNDISPTQDASHHRACDIILVGPDPRCCQRPGTYTPGALTEWTMVVVCLFLLYPNWEKKSTWNTSGTVGLIWCSDELCDFWCTITETARTWNTGVGSDEFAARQVRALGPFRGVFFLQRLWHGKRSCQCRNSCTPPNMSRQHINSKQVVLERKLHWVQDWIAVGRIAPWRKVIKRFWFVPSANVSWGEPFGWTQNNTSPSGGLVVFMMSVWLNLRKTNLSTGLWMLRRGRTVEHLSLHFRWVEKWGLCWNSRADSTSRF